MITVFRNTDATEDIVCTVSDDNATYSAALMGKDEIVVDVVTQAVLPVSVLDYIRYDGYAYTLNRQPEFTKEADVKYRYNLVFEGAIYNLLDKGFEHPITKQTRFTLTGTLRDFVQLAVDNANLTDSGWSVGDVPDTPRKNIVFESMTVGDVLDKLATEFSVEYHSLGKRISFYDRYENITQIVFKQGMGNGLFTLTRRNVDSENTVTRAVLYGGTKNLPLGYRNGSEYLRWADPATGNMYVENFSDYPKVVERDVYFDDVYPHFEGGLDGVQGDHHEIVRCAAIDFDVNDYMIGDVKAKINFITGDLTGNDFEFNYNHATHEVTLIRKEDDTVLPDAEGNRPLIPNDNKCPQIGDQINFTDITMPQAYVTRFENQLHDKGVEWLAINSQLRVKFELSIDHRYLRREGISLKIGDVVRIQVPEDGIDRQLRIISLEKRLKDGSITCEVSNFLRHSWEKEVEGKLMAARDKAEIIRSEVLYDLNASKEWTARHFARLAGGNRLSGDQDIEGNVKVTKDISGDNIHAEKDISAGRKISAQAGEIVDITSENIETAILKVLDKIIAKDQTLSGKISSADFLSGLLGYGWRIDNAGRAEMRSLTLREWLDVPELRYNRVQVIGSEWWVTEGGIISDVQSSGSQCVVTLKLEEGDLNPFRPADILKGIYHTGTGFQTVMLRVDAVSDDGAMTVTPRYPQLLPQKFMDVARIGNFTDKERQRSILISSKEGRILILGDVDGWDVQPRMVKMIFGDTSGFIHPEFGDMSGYNAFLENILMTGRIYQKSADGQTLKPVPVNKGAWEPGTYYYYDEVTRNGCLWLCAADSTTAEPAEGSPDWIKRVDKGADGKASYLHIKYSDDGTSFTSNNGETPGSWMGQYTDFTAEASNDFSKYTWAKVKGGDGVPGAILRSRGVWKPSGVYIRSAEFIDWVVYGPQKYRYVVKSGVATVPAGILPTNTAYWTAFNEMEPVAAPMFLGETASFDVVGSQAIRVLEDDSSEYGWMLTGGKILHTRTGLALSASGKIEAPDGLTIEMSGKSLEEWTQQKADAAKQAAIAAAAADAADKVNAVQVGSVNLIDGSEEITITAPSNAAYSYKRLPLHVRPGDKFALSVKSIEILAGTPEGFTVNIVDSTYNKLLALGELTLDKRTAVYKIPENVIEQDGWFLMYAGELGKTNGNSVTYHEVMLVKGNRPALTWSPSLNDQKAQTQEMVDASLPATRNLALKTGGQLDFRVGSYTGYKFSLAEQPVIGQEYALSWDDLDFSGTTTVLFRLYSTSGEKSINIKYTMSKGPGSALLTIPQDADLSVQYDLYITGSDATFASGYVKNLMWAKGNKVTSWAPAIEDTKEALAAAQESADKANAMLADIASDDKLTPGEKQETKREWEIIQGEKPILTAQADTIQLSTADYLAVYNALSAYITPLLADMTTTSTITGAVFSARFKTYYDAKTTLLKNIQYYSSGQFRITTIDATELDPDTYYPVTFTLFSATDCKATFDIGTVLGASGTPPWATHAQGFSCNCAWESNGNRFGTLPVKRYIHSFAYSFAGSTPVGSIGQVNQTSMEYIYVRGGGRYTVRTSGVPFIELHPSGYHWTSGSSSGDVPTRTSVETPVVDLEAAKKTAQDAKDAAASLNTTVTGLKNFTDEAFADGIVDRAEAASIEKYINTVNEAGSAADATYGKLYNNPYLGGSAKTNLTTNKGVFDAAKISLLNAISAAIADGKASEAEVRNVNAKYTEFNAAYKDFTVSIEAANQAVQNELKSYSDAAQESADGANAMLADIASDDKLTPGEKQEAKREWEIIQGENPILTAQAKPTLTDTTAYLDAYNALSAYITPLLADMTATSTITGSVFRSKFKDYYNARAKLLNNIQYYSSGQFQIVTIDATALDPDTYYPVTFNLWNASDSKAAIEISAILSDSGTPPWATHAQGFSCSCAWETNGNRWGAMTIKRYVRSFDFRFSDVTPIGSIGQVYQSSVEYIYVRGGGRYKVRATYCEGIMLRPTGYSYGDVASIGLLKSVETPVVDLEAAKTTAQSALGAANALSTTVTGLKNFTDSAFADGVVTRSEAAAIGKLTNQVAETAESVKAQYYNRYNHADLNEIGKRNLTAKYALFDAAKAALLASIATAIADGIATAAEQADVDTKHNAFNSALSELNVAFGVADEAIRDAIRAYANSAVGTGQDAVAKNIGFSSYEDMTAKAKAGQTIMDGGRINADLIETATLIAENVITKPASDSDQRRIEIRRETNALAAYDSAGNTVLLVKGDTVDDVNTLINPTAVSLSSDFTPRSFSWSASSELEKYESAVCAELAVTSAGFYKISIPDIQAEHLTQCAAGAYSYGRMDFVLTTSNASDVLVQIPVAKGSAENWRTHVRAGTYTVYAKSRLYLRVRFYGRLEGYASALASESMNVKLYTSSQKVTCTGSTDSAMRTSLFANGLAATYSNQEYFVVFKGGAGIPYIMGRGDTRLLSKSGKYGLRLTDSGVLATSNSTNDNNWGALMHGLVAWGIVNTGTGTIAKYWTSPAGNITSLTAAAAGWGYVTITMFGGGFTSTSSYAVDAKPNNTADQVAYASVQNKKTTSFKIGTGNGAGAVATEVVFFIFNLDTYKY